MTFGLTMRKALKIGFCGSKDILLSGWITQMTCTKQTFYMAIGFIYMAVFSVLAIIGKLALHSMAG